MPVPERTSEVSMKKVLYGKYVDALIRLSKAKEERRVAKYNLYEKRHTTSITYEELWEELSQIRQEVRDCKKAVQTAQCAYNKSCTE